MTKSTVILFLIFISLFSDKNFARDKEYLNIALINPKLTKDVLYKYDSSFNPTDSWELFLMSRGIKYEMLNDDELGDVKDGINVVIIPSMEVVSSEIVENIEKVLAAGKGVLIAGNFARFDDEGNYMSFDFQKRIIGFQINRLKADEGISVNHSLNGNTPFTAGMDPGQKILLSRKPSLYYSYDLSEENNTCGEYFQKGNEYSGIVNFMPGKKRLLWYGFNFEQLVGKNRELFVLNSLKWLSSIPQIYVNYWPADFSSVVILYKNIENSFEIDDTYHSGSESNKMNYFIIPQILEKSDYYLNDLYNSGNINLLWDDYYLSGLRSKELLQWLKSVKSSIGKYSDQDHYGVLSFGEFYDSSISGLLKESGYDFIFSSGYSDDYSLSFDSTDNLYSFTRSISPGADYLSRLNFILNAGGIGYLDIDSVDDDIYNFLNGKKCWVATFSDIIDWRVKTKQLELRVNNIRNNYYEISIENNASSTIQNAGIWISLPDVSGNILPEYSGNTGRLTFDYKKKLYFFKIPALPGFQKITFGVTVPK